MRQGWSQMRINASTDAHCGSERGGQPGGAAAGGGSTRAANMRINLAQAFQVKAEAILSHRCYSYCYRRRRRRCYRRPPLPLRLRAGRQFQEL